MQGNLIYEKISAIMAELEAIPKSRENKSQGYNFRGIDEMYNALHPLFAKHKVFFTSRIINSRREERATKSGGVMIHTILLVRFKAFTTDGSYIISEVEGEGSDTGDKSTNKAMSSAYKYLLMQLLMIPTKEEKDIEIAHPQFVNKKTNRQFPTNPIPQPTQASEKDKELILRLLKEPVFSDEQRELTTKKLENITSDVAQSWAKKLATTIVEHYLVDDSIVSEEERKSIKEKLPNMALKDVCQLAKKLKETTPETK